MVQMPSMICVSEQYKRFKLQICFFKSDSIFNILLEISSFQKQEFSNIYISNYTFESCINLK